MTNNVANGTLWCEGGDQDFSHFLKCSSISIFYVQLFFDCLFFDKGGPKVVANGFAKESDNSWERFAETISSIRSSILYLMEAISFYYCLTMCVLTSES